MALTIDYSQKAGQRLEFYWGDDLSDASSDKQIPWIKIQPDTQTVIDRPVEKQDEVRYESEWQAFIIGEDQYKGQTRIENVDWLTPQTVKDLRHLGIRTVEHLAHLSDGVVSTIPIMSIRSFRDKAQNHLQAQDAEDQQKLHDFYAQAENTRKAQDAKIDELQNLVQRLLGEKETAPATS